MIVTPPLTKLSQQDPGDLYIYTYWSYNPYKWPKINGYLGNWGYNPTSRDYNSTYNWARGPPCRMSNSHCPIARR